MSDAVNELIRQGPVAEARRSQFEPRTRRLGIGIDVSDVTGALDLMEGREAR